jgi:hypothetical protein
VFPFTVKLPVADRFPSVDNVFPAPGLIAMSPDRLNVPLPLSSKLPSPIVFAPVHLTSLFVAPVPVTTPRLLNVRTLKAFASRTINSVAVALDGKFGAVTVPAVIVT